MDKAQHQIDTVLHKIITEDNVYQTILTEQHETYEFMLYMFLGLITLIATVTVLGNFYFFKRKIETTIQDELEKVRDELKKEIENSINSKVANEISQIKGHLTIVEYRADASVFHLQGNSSLKANLYEQACFDFIAAASSYVESKDKGNLIRVLKLITNECFPKLTKINIENIEKYNGFNFDDLCKKLESVDKEGELTDLIRGLRKGYDNIKDIRV